MIFTEGYMLKTVGLTVTSDASQTIDIALVSEAGSIRSDNSDKGAGRKPPSITVGRDNVLHLTDLYFVDRIALYDIRGRLLWKHTMNPLTASSPQTLIVRPRVSSGKYIICMNRKGSPIRRMIVIP